LAPRGGFEPPRFRLTAGRPTSSRLAEQRDSLRLIRTVDFPRSPRAFSVHSSNVYVGPTYPPSLKHRICCIRIDRPGVPSFVCLPRAATDGTRYKDGTISNGDLSGWARRSGCDGLSRRMFYGAVLGFQTIGRGGCRATRKEYLLPDYIHRLRSFVQKHPNTAKSQWPRPKKRILCLQSTRSIQRTRVRNSASVP
jgi:hypothetical protein